MCLYLLQQNQYTGMMVFQKPLLINKSNSSWQHHLLNRVEVIFAKYLQNIYIFLLDIFCAKCLIIDSAENKFIVSHVPVIDVFWVKQHHNLCDNHIWDFKRIVMHQQKFSMNTDLQFLKTACLFQTKFKRNDKYA